MALGCRWLTSVSPGPLRNSGRCSSARTTRWSAWPISITATAWACRCWQIGLAGAPPPPGGAHYPGKVSFPATAFFRFEGTLADLASCRCGQLELYDPLAIQTIDVHGRRVPLETDLTTPLAHSLAHAGQDVIPYAAFVGPRSFRR